MSLLSKVKDIFKGGSSAKKKRIYHNVRLDNPEDYWDVIGELGDGAYGKVYKAQRKDTCQLAALKQVDLEGEDDLETFMVEIDILCESRHPNIVELIEAYHFDGNLWMYLEYCDGGAVDTIMIDLDRPLNEPQIALLCYHLCNALQYIHANKIIHRDLKAGNVLLTMEGGVKLADFGVSAKNKNTFDKRGTFIGTPYWLAPEVILCETFIDAKYDYKADIWSLGISLIEFAQMDPPNHDVSPVRVMLKIQKSDPPKLDFPSKWSKEFNDFIAKCLTKDPVLRPSAEDLLRHPFLSKPLDKKPIIDLLLEYNAEVVEEDVEDDTEDQDPCRMSSVPESFTDSSRFDAESVISVDKDNTLPVPNDKLPSPSLEEKEANSTVCEKRISKKPAPLPPIVNVTSPKKGPAPAVPSPPVVTSPTSYAVTVSAAATSNAFTVSTAISNAVAVATDNSNAVPVPTSSTSVIVSTSSEVAVTSKLSVVSSPKSPTETNLVNSTTTVTSQKLPQTSENIVNVSEITSATSTPSRESTSSPSHTGHIDTSSDKYIPEVLKDDPSSCQMTEESFIDSIPVGKSVYVYDADTYDREMVTVNNTSVGERESVTLESKSQTVIQDAVTASSEGVTIALDTIQSPAEDVTKLNIVTSESSHNGAQDLFSTTAPVTLSIISPQSASVSAVSEDKAQASDVLLASISSEGTVIVRTPTPTPVDSKSKLTKKNESKVTYTVAKDAQIEPALDLDSTVSISLSEESRISLSPKQSRKADGSLLQQQDSLGEAEAQAVLILETAINSAMDSSFSGFELLEGTKGEIVVIASEKDSEPMTEDSNLDNSIKDISGHKLDESEVLITNASIPEDEEKESPKKSGKSSSEKLSPLNESLVSVSANEEAHHVSVVSVDEGKEEVTVVSDGETSSGEVVVDGPETTQMSLTIEGTTLEDTDVDEVENSTSSAVSTLSNEKRTREKSVINTTEVKKNKVVSTVSSASTIPSSPAEEPVSTPLVPLQPIQNGIRRHNSRASDRSDTDTTSTVGSDKENRHLKEDVEIGEEVTLRRTGGRPTASPVLDSETAARNLKNKELQASIALRKKTRKRTRKFVIDGVVVTTTTSKVIYGDDEEQGMLNSAHLARKQELRELKLVQKREQKQFQDLALKANIARQEQEKKFEIEKANLLRNYDSQIENLIRQQKQLVEKAEIRQETELKIESKRTRIDQERELKAFRESLKQEGKLLKQEVDLLPKDKRKENLKVRKEQLERDQMEREKACLERLNDNHEMALKRLNDKHRKHIALKERQFLEEKHQLLRARESALWDMEERHIQDKHQLAKEQLKDIYFLQRLQMTIRHNVELEQVRRFNQQKEEELLKRQHEERRQLPKRIRQEMKTREKMFREQMRISMTQLPSHEQEKEQIKKFQEQEKIKYDKERKRAEMKHKKQMEELTATTEASIKELVHLQNEKGKLLTEHETYKLKSLDEEYQKELREWKSNLAPRKQKLEEDFERQLREQENFYGEYLERGLGLCIPTQSMSSLSSTHH